jgi:hypothetical protein
MRSPMTAGLAALALTGLAACGPTVVEQPAPAAGAGATTSATVDTQATSANTTVRTDTTTVVTTTTTTTSGSAGGAVSGAAAVSMTGPNTLALVPVNNSGFTGSATLTNTGERTRVSLVLNSPANSSVDADHDVRLHTGTCMAPGMEVAELNDVRGDGRASDSELNFTMSQLLNGNHILMVEEDDGERAVACVALPRAM